MGKTLQEAELHTRTARKRLEPGLYWRALDTGIHIGYRRAAAGGVWLVRWRHEAGYRREIVGTADDELAEATLDFDGAKRGARQIVEQVRQQQQAEALGPVATVVTAVGEYVAMRDARDTRRAGRTKTSDAAQRLARYVLGRKKAGGRTATKAAALAAVELHKLTERDLLRWRDKLPADLKATTRQRLFNDLKAALNAAYVSRRDVLPATFPATVKFGLRAIADDNDSDPVARDNQILPDADVSKLVIAAKVVDAERGFNGDLYRLVIVLAATGARFSQVVRMRVSDVQAAKGRLMVPASRKGRGNKNFANPVPVGADVLEALAPIIRGRSGDTLLLERWRSVQVEGGAWRPDTRGAWQSSAELRRPWQMIAEHAELPDTIPYALRHSSIVRGIRANLPIRLVAALHDTSTAMIEKHYARWVTTGLEDMARAAIVTLTQSVDIQKRNTT